jgi:hypothetical protein
MMTPYLEECDKFDGSSNFMTWKLTLWQMLMEEDKIWEHFDKMIDAPTNQEKSTNHNKKT